MQYFDVESFVEVLSSVGKVVVAEVPFSPGSYVSAWLPIARIRAAGRIDSGVEDGLHEAFVFDKERSFRQDFASQNVPTKTRNVSMLFERDKDRRPTRMAPTPKDRPETGCAENNPTATAPEVLCRGKTLPDRNPPRKKAMSKVRSADSAKRARCA